VRAFSGRDLAISVFSVKTLHTFNRLSDLKIGKSGPCETNLPHLPCARFLRKLFVALQRGIPSKAFSEFAFGPQFWTEENQEV
jgi:hypothetical protein